MDSMKKMRELAPELEKLKSKHGGDKVKLAQAQADYYKEKGINPGSGCIPYLLQIVVLIAFFNVFTKTLSNYESPSTGFNTLLYEPLKFKEGDIINTKFLYLDVAKPDTFSLPSTDLKLPGLFLILAALLQLLSVKVTNPQIKTEEKIAEKSKGGSDDFQVAIQKSMTSTFPLITLFVGIRFPSGLALYWLVFSGMQVFRQVRSQGWGEVGTWLKKIKLVKS
jgi:YidC/Oxa1 family membrane protein insertase